MDVVLENRGLIDGREISETGQTNYQIDSIGGTTDPRVKTLSSEVFPLAPSPLSRVRPLAQYRT